MPSIAQDQEHAATLARELAEMRVKVSASGHDSYGVWREGNNRPLLDHLVGAGEQRRYRAAFLNHALATS
jgi:hypothetical protein